MTTLLVVEDDPSLRDLYRLELEDDGYTVLTAVEGHEALEKLDGAHVDAVILDLRMEGLDGVRTLAEIIKVRRDLPVIINSAYSDYKADFGTWGADAYVVKSADLAELKATLRQVLRRRKVAA